MVQILYPLRAISTGQFPELNDLSERLGDLDLSEPVSVQYETIFTAPFAKRQNRREKCEHYQLLRKMRSWPRSDDTKQSEIDEVQAS